MELLQGVAARECYIFEIALVCIFFFLNENSIDLGSQKKSANHQHYKMTRNKMEVWAVLIVR